MKFTLIMPTYNDSDSIEESLESIVSQTYNNWELIIVDDGSTDNTKEVIERYIKENNEKRIKYFYQENQDQLNAIRNHINKITGDYVYIIHSDDLLLSDNILKKVENFISNNKEFDAYLAKELQIIDEKSNITGTQRISTYNKSEYIIPLQLLWLGRQLFCDFAFFKKEIFENQVNENYLTWNTPFWLNCDKNCSMLNIKTVDFCFIKYRVFEGNYINNEIGKLNVINGELRTATNLMKYFNIPFYKTQYFIFRVFNKLKLNYKPIYSNRETKNKAKIIKFIIEKRYNNSYKSNIFLNNLIAFYTKDNNRKIIIDKIDSQDFIYYGKDMRKFNKDLLNNSLSKIYQKIIEEMALGFDTIEVQNKKDKEKMEFVTKFLCINKFINIEVAQS